VKRLPGGDVLHDLLTNQKLTLQEVGNRYGTSRQAVHKVYSRWAEKNGVDWRKRPVRTATKEN
jgi:predicted transcriptional regulator